MKFPLLFINIYYETLQKIIQIFDKFEEQSRKNKLFHFFRLIVQEDEKMKNLLIFVQISIMDCSFFLHIVHIYMYISVVKACHNFFLSRREQYMYNGCILILCNMCWENISIDITFNKEMSDFDGNFLNNKVQYPKLSRTPLWDRLRLFTVV